jgi:DNA-binding transcriptional ArsR family regulator
MDRMKRLDPASLKALAHPLRVELFHALAEGPATASQLARRFDESSGATSYHLRQLARFGFIEEDLDRGDGRDRWWRTAVRGIQLDVR